MTIEKLDYVVDTRFFFDDGRWYMDALGFKYNGNDYTGFDGPSPIDGHLLSWIEPEGFKLEPIEVDGENPIALNEWFNASDSITSDIVGLLADVVMGEDTLHLLWLCQEDEYDDCVEAFESATGITLTGTKITIFEYNGDGTFTYVVSSTPPLPRFKEEVQLPMSKGQLIQLPPAKPALARTYNASVGSVKVDVSVDTNATHLEIKAKTNDVILKYGTTEVSTSNFDEYIPAGSTIERIVPSGVTALNVKSITSTATVVIIQK